MKKNAQLIIDLISSNFEKINCELNYSSNFELLVAVILSSQTTDAQVNKVLENLFKVANTPEKMAIIPKEKLEELIYSCGFYKNKAKNLIAMSKTLLNNFNGIVPTTVDELVTLNGVGRKTANVVVSELYNTPAIAVDTHVFRVSNRIGLVDAKNPVNCEQQLMMCLPKTLWKTAHFSLVLFGRYICKAKKPMCDTCNVKNYCKYFKLRK